MKNEKKKKKFTFIGAVLKYGKPFCDKWEASTMAETRAKAISNLKYRFKKQFNLIASVPIEFIGDLFD